MVFGLVVNKNNIPRITVVLSKAYTPRFPAVRIAKGSTIEPTIDLKETAGCILILHTIY